MNFLGTPEFKVGVLVVLVASLIGFMSVRGAEGPGILGASREHHFVVDNAAQNFDQAANQLTNILYNFVKLDRRERVEAVAARRRERVVGGARRVQIEAEIIG